MTVTERPAARQGVLICDKTGRDNRRPRGAVPEEIMKKLQEGMTLMQLLVLLGVIGVAVAVAVSYLR